MQIVFVIVLFLKVVVNSVLIKDWEYGFICEFSWGKKWQLEKGHFDVLKGAWGEECYLDRYICERDFDSPNSTVDPPEFA